MLSGLAPVAARLRADVLATRQWSGWTFSPDGRRTAVRLDDRALVVAGRHGEGHPRAVATFTGGISAHTWLPDGSLCAVGAPSPGDDPGVFVVGDGSRVARVDLPGSPESAVLLDPDLPGRGGALVRIDDEGGRRAVVVGPRGAMRPLGPAGDLDQWVTDIARRAVAGVRWDADGSLTAFVPGALTWRQVARIGAPDGLMTRPLEVLPDGSGLLCTGPFGGDEVAVGVLDLRDGSSRCLTRVAGRDVEAVLLDRRTRHPQAVRLAGLRRTHVVVDGSATTTRRDLQLLSALLDGDVSVVTWSLDESLWLVRVDDDRSPDRHVVYDRRARTVHRLPPGRTTAKRPTGRRRTARRGTLPVRLDASDGVAIEGYLDLPAGPGAAPTIVLVHGGPWGSDIWGWDPDVGWLTSRGWACLRVGFRGSEGRGTAFLTSADHDWGGRMQQDLVDAAAWAVEHGYADRDRVAVMGASYGGYAALAAATIGPPVFCAAVAVCAPADLVALLAPMRERRAHLHSIFLARLGDPDRDREHLTERSPITHARRCHTPVLLVHGALDGLIPVEHTHRMAAALRDHGRPYELLVFPDEGHSISAPTNRRRLLRSADRFMRRQRRAREVHA